MRMSTLTVTLLIVAGCDADHSLGQLDRDGGIDVTSADSASNTSSVDSPAPLADAAPAGSGIDGATFGPADGTQTWTGWIEGYKFPSGSDVVQLSFTTDPAGRMVGQVVFGSGTPPPVDPNVAYLPPGITQSFLVEGFPYVLTTDSSVSTHRIRFGIYGNDPWSSWCPFQPSYAGSNRCMPPWQQSFHGPDECSLTLLDGTVMAVDCAKVALCDGYQVCWCDGASCTVNHESGARSYDLAIVGTMATGAFDSEYAMYLVKDQ